MATGTISGNNIGYIDVGTVLPNETQTFKIPRTGLLFIMVSSSNANQGAALYMFKTSGSTQAAQLYPVLTHANIVATGAVDSSVTIQNKNTQRAMSVRIY